ncbi:ABC transporter permease subunit OS=Streptomyces tendae OX=1932 GN=GUR47_16620 PE=3 SV=1 [Streptomyces tendae]
MMALSMAVIASVIGAGGLGDRVYQALASVDVGAALAAGIPIVLLAVVLDRVTAAAGQRLGEAGKSPVTWLYALVVAAAVALAGRLAGLLDWPDGWEVDIASPSTGPSTG